MSVTNSSRSISIVSFIIPVNSGSNCPNTGKDMARSTRGSTSTGPGVIMHRRDGDKSSYRFIIISP
ncbi:hypothetical protein D3C75_1350610 [compost metagenome]